MYPELGFVKLKAYTVSEVLYRKIYAQIFYVCKFYRTYDQMNIASALESERPKNFTLFATSKRGKKPITLLSLLFMS